VRSMPSRRDDAGFSLPELLMVMLLSSVVLAALAVTFTSSMRAARASSARVSTTADARIGMDAMLRRLRVAVIPPGKSSAFDMSGMAAGTNYPVGVTVPSATEVAFFTSVTTGGSTADPAPTLVDYSIDTTANCLRERMTPASGAVPSYTWPAASTRSRCLLFGVVNADSSPLFTYFADGKLRTPALAILQAADNAKTIHSVGIDLAVTGPTTGDVPPAKLAGRVTLANLAGADLASGG